jgi:hypothetical protein
MALSIFVALFVQIWIIKLASMNFFNSVAIYAFVFVFLIVLMEPKEMSHSGPNSMTFISSRRVTLINPSIQMVAQ